MDTVNDVRRSASPERAARDASPELSTDESRLAMMRRVKRLPVAERIALLDRMCREQTRLAIGARRVR